MEEYHKIDTLFEREESGKHGLIYGKFRNSAVEMCKDLKWVFTEKVDGTNLRIHWDGHKVEFNGRTDNAQLHVDLIKFINATFCTPEVEQLFEQKFGEKEVFIFGEGYGAGIQKGGGYRSDKSMIVFDVRVGKTWLRYEDVKSIASIFGLETVPIVLEGTLDDAIKLVKYRKNSFIGDSQEFEGVVGRLSEEMYDRYGNRMIVKIKKCDFN